MDDLRIIKDGRSARNTNGHATPHPRMPIPVPSDLSSC